MLTDNFYMVVKHNNKMIILNFKNGSYNISDYKSNY